MKDFVLTQLHSLDLKRRVLQQRCLSGLDKFSFKFDFLPLGIFDDFAYSTRRGFGVPEFVSKLFRRRECNTCNGWEALRCTMCKGTGKVHFQVINYQLGRGEAATAEYVADAVVSGRAELVHVPSFDVSCPMPSKECPSCDGTGAMSCLKCKNDAPIFRISADEIAQTPLAAYRILQKMNYPYENIVDSMRDPKIAEFWLFTMPRVLGGFTFDDDAKKRIWWNYKESMRYDRIRDSVARRKPGWEIFQDILISLDPLRARSDPVVVKNVPYYKAKKALEAEVMKFDIPPRPDKWGTKELKLPLSRSSWSDEELKDPKKSSEMTALLNAQREMANKILDVQWETKWRQEKLGKLLAEKLRPHMQSLDTAELPQPIAIPKEEKKETKRRWWFF